MTELRKLPRVAAVHDISGFGKCALTTALPVISACGAEVCPLPTAILSTNTHFEGFTFYDYTPNMNDHLRHWEVMGVGLDALYSGFLGSVQQIDIVLDAAKRFSPSLTVIDPVMGDNGVRYATYTPEMCEHMKKLTSIADVLTPNYTEGCILTDTPYDPEKTSPADLERMAEKIALLGGKQVVITGIERGDQLLNCSLDENGYVEHAVPLLPYRMHGTGDLFASVLTGGLITEHSLYESIDSAARFTAFTMERSRMIEDADRRGVCFEPYLYLLRKGLFDPSETEK